MGKNIDENYEFDVYEYKSLIKSNKLSDTEKRWFRSRIAFLQVKSVIPLAVSYGMELLIKN